VREDGRAFKPGYDVKPGDIVVLHYARKILTVRILEVPVRVTPKLRPDTLYEVVTERREDPRDWLLDGSEI
jgi:ribosomal 50S subunit-recycling heat shock protein